MNTHAHTSGDSGGLDRPPRAAKIFAALFATAALCLGPAMSAAADESADDAGSSEQVLTEAAAASSQDEVVDDAGDAGDTSDAGDDAGVVDSSDESTGGNDGTGDAGTSETDDSAAPEEGDDATDDEAQGDTDALSSQGGNEQREEKVGKKKPGDRGDHWCHDNEAPSLADEAESGESPVSFSATSVVFDRGGKQDGRTGQGPDRGDRKCEPPQHQPPTVEVSSPDECLAWGEGSSVELRATFGNLKKGAKYWVTVTLNGSQVGESQTFTAWGNTKDWSTNVTEAGHYTVTVTGPKHLSASDSAKVKQCPRSPEISVTPGDCLFPDSGGEDQSIAEIWASGLKPGHKYRVTVSMGEGEVFSEWVTAGEDGTAYTTVALSEPGSYLATISGHGKKGQSASQWFEVAECELVPITSVAVATCVDGELQATLSADDLEPGGMYPASVTGPSGFTWSGSLTGSEAGTASQVVVLGVDGTYTAYVEGADPVEFSAATTCVKKTVVVTERETLANTGSTGTQPMIWGGAVALLLAAGLMIEPIIARRVRRSRS